MNASDRERIRLEKLEAIKLENHISPEAARREERAGRDAARREEWPQRTEWKITRGRK